MENVKVVTIDEQTPPHPTISSEKSVVVVDNSDMMPENDQADPSLVSEVKGYVYSCCFSVIVKVVVKVVELLLLCLL